MGRSGSRQHFTGWRSLQQEVRRVAKRFLTENVESSGSTGVKRELATGVVDFFG